MGNFLLEKFFKTSRQKVSKTVNDFYELSATDISGQEFKFSQLKGYKALLIVNVASQCGLAKSHYEQLNKIYDELKDQQFQILAFPCNQFNNQETMCERDIEKYVRNKFKVDFLLFSKIEVNGTDPHPVYRYLRSNSQLHDPINGLSQEIPWNFSKFLIDNQGIIRGFYPPTIEPQDLVPIIKKMLA